MAMVLMIMCRRVLNEMRSVNFTSHLFIAGRKKHLPPLEYPSNATSIVKKGGARTHSHLLQAKSVTKGAQNNLLMGPPMNKLSSLTDIS